MQDNKNKKGKKPTGLVFVFANAILFLLVSLFFLFGTLLEVHHHESAPKKIVGIELLIGNEHPMAVKSGWLFVGFWVVCFLLSIQTSHTKEYSTYRVVLSVAAAILLINTVQQVEIIPPDAHSSYAVSYYIALGAIFLNASIGLRNVVQRHKTVDSGKTDNQIHINIINNHGAGNLSADPKREKRTNK